MPENVSISTAVVLIGCPFGRTMILSSVPSFHLWNLSAVSCLSYRTWNLTNVSRLSFVTSSGKTRLTQEQTVFSLIIDFRIVQKAKKVFSTDAHM